MLFIYIRIYWLHIILVQHSHYCGLDDHGLMTDYNIDDHNVDTVVLMTVVLMHDLIYIHVAKV